MMDEQIMILNRSITTKVIDNILTEIIHKTCGTNQDILVSDDSLNITGSFKEELTLLGWMTDPALSQSNELVSSTDTNPLLPSTSKRAGESFPISASAKQQSVHCLDLLARKTNNTNIDMDDHAILHQNNKLETTIVKKTRVSQIKKESTKRRQEHQDPGNWRWLTHQASDDRCYRWFFKWKESASASEYWWREMYQEVRRSCKNFASRRAKRVTNFSIKYWTVHVPILVKILPIFKISCSTLRFRTNLRASAHGLHLDSHTITRTSKGWRWITVFQGHKIWYSLFDDK